MNEKKKILILLAIIAFILAIVIPLYISNTSKSNTIVKAVKEMFQIEETQMLILTKDDCVYSAQYIPLVNKLSNYYNFEYKVINANELKNKDLKKVLDLLGIKEEDFPTPYTFIFKNGKIIEKFEGHQYELALFNHLQKFGVIAEDVKYLSDVERFNSIKFLNFEEYKKLVTSSETNLVVVGQESCDYCEIAKQGINQINKDYNLNIAYFSLSLLTGDQQAEFSELLDYFQNKSAWTTPVLLITKNSQVIQYLEGYKSIDSYLDFLRQNKIIN